MLKNLKSEIKIFITIAVIAVILSVGGILLLKTLQPVPVEQQVFVSQEECEAQTGFECVVQLCDYNCPEDFKKGWVPATKPLEQELDTSNWQTYRNDEFGFEVKYPTSFVVREQLGGIDDSYLTKLLFEDSLNPNFLDIISIEIKRSGRFEELEPEIRKTKLVGHVTDRINSEVALQGDGYKGRKLNYDISTSGKNVSFSTAIIGNGKYLYTIESRSELVDQILSAFRFIN